eukprot:164390-Prymnesium_polylepis.1
MRGHVMYASRAVATAMHNARAQPTTPRTRSCTMRVGKQRITQMVSTGLGTWQVFAPVRRYTPPAAGGHNAITQGASSPITPQRNNATVLKGAITPY